MNFQIITVEQYKALMERLDEIQNSLANKGKSPKEILYDSTKLMETLFVSKSTLQKMRDGGYIGFSTVMGKIVYTQFDINQMIEKNYKSPFR